MMGVPPDQADRLPYWKFTALRSEWNDRHETDDEDTPAELPSEEYVRERQAELADELAIDNRAER